MTAFKIFMMLAMLAGCVSLPKVTGSGREVSDSRELASYDAVEVYGDLVVNLVPGKGTNVKITGDDNIVGLVKTTLDDETLTLKLECDCQATPTNPIVVDIQGEALRSIRVSDSVKLNIKGLRMEDVEVELTDNAKLRLIDINADQLGVFASDSSEVEATGSTNEFFIQAEDKAKFSGDEFNIEAAEVSSTDKSDVKLKVNSKLEAELSDDAILRLKKQPKEQNTQIEDSAVILNQF